MQKVLSSLVESVTIIAHMVIRELSAELFKEQTTETKSSLFVCVDCSTSPRDNHGSIWLLKIG